MVGAAPPAPVPTARVGVLRQQARAALAAVGFLTRIPLPRRSAWARDDLARSTTYFPLVGALVGAVGAGIFAAGSMVWPQPLAVVVSTAGTILLTGALHEDALADAADGLGGGWTAEQVLAIMKDSRVGSYGLVAVVLAIVTKLVALSTLTQTDVIRALVAAHALARWSSLPLMTRLPYAREATGTGTAFAATVTPFRLAIGTALMLGVVVPMLGIRSVGVLIGAVIMVALSGAYFRNRLGGITGDCLGAANQVVELTAYLILAAHIPPHISSPG